VYTSKYMRGNMREIWQKAYTGEVIEVMNRGIVYEIRRKSLCESPDIAGKTLCDDKGTHMVIEGEEVVSSECEDGAERVRRMMNGISGGHVSEEVVPKLSKGLRGSVLEYTYGCGCMQNINNNGKMCNNHGRL